MLNASATKPARRHWFAITGLVTAAMALTSCSGMGQPDGDNNTNADLPAGGVVDQSQWEQLEEAAIQEGEVVVYSSLSDVERTFEGFEDLYPDINVTIERSPTAELISRLDQELAVQASGADVILHSLPSWFEEHDTDGSFAPLQVSPENDANGWNERIDGRNYSETLATPFLLGVNTTTGEMITEADQIFDHAEQEQVALVEPDITLGQAYQYQLWLEEYGDDFLERISELNVTTYASNVPLAQDLAAGAQDYGMALAPSTITALHDEGAPVEAVIPDVAISGVLYNSSVAASAPNPNAAQLFVNWLASEDGSETLVEGHAPAAAPTEVEGAVPWESISHPDLSEWTTEYWQEWIVENWNPHFG